MRIEFVVEFEAHVKITVHGSKMERCRSSACRLTFAPMHPRNLDSCHE